jgi:hypothetical protein
MTRVFAGFVASLALLAAVFAGAAEKSPAPPATQPAAAQEAPRQRVKPSDPPDLTLLFTDQVVGYINPCG